MNEKQADLIITKIATVYRGFELTKDRVKLWREFMGQINYDLAEKRLSHHIANNKYPPTIAEILNPDDNGKKKKWEEPDTLSPAAVLQGGYILM